MKLLFVFFIFLLSQNASANKCLVNGSATDPAIIARCGQPYQAANPDSELMDLARAEVEIGYLHEFNCGKKNFSPCEKYRFYLNETSKHAADAFCKRDAICLGNYRKAVLDQKEYYAARNFLAVYANPDQYKDVFLNPREVADEARAYLAYSANPALREIAGKEFIARLCRKEKHEELGSSAASCKNFVDSYILGLERKSTASAN